MSTMPSIKASMSINYSTSNMKFSSVLNTKRNNLEMLKQSLILRENNTKFPSVVGRNRYSENNGSEPIDFLHRPYVKSYKCLPNGPKNMC